MKKDALNMTIWLLRMMDAAFKVGAAGMFLTLDAALRKIPPLTHAFAAKIYK